MAVHSCTPDCPPDATGPKLVTRRAVVVPALYPYRVGYMAIGYGHAGSVTVNAASAKRARQKATAMLAGKKVKLTTATRLV